MQEVKRFDYKTFRKRSLIPLSFSERGKRYAKYFSALLDWRFAESETNIKVAFLLYVLYTPGGMHPEHLVLRPLTPKETQ